MANPSSNEDSNSDNKNLYICSSNTVTYSCSSSHSGASGKLTLKPFAESCSYLQYRVPLTEHHPCFYVRVDQLSVNSKISIGIAGDNIRDDVHLGNHNNTIGYHSDSGMVVSNHCSRSQTKPSHYSIGDTVGMCITNFSQSSSSVMIIKNDRPVCTKYHYEKDLHKYYPTITLEHGPISLTVTWHDDIPLPNVPKYLHTNPCDWMVMPGFSFDSLTNTFCVRDQSYVGDEKVLLSSLQSPEPLSQERSFYEVELAEVSLNSRNPSLIICLVSCGAHLCAPSSSICYEVLKFTINHQAVENGDKLGWGIHYLPPFLDEDKLRQPIVCCVTLNSCCQTSVCYLEPEGGYYPFIAFTPQDFKLKLSLAHKHLPVKFNTMNTSDHLRILKLHYELERSLRHCELSEFTYSQDLRVDLLSDHVDLTLDGKVTGVHTLQYYGHPLTQERPVFQINITRLTEDSVLCVGVAGRLSSTSKYPGRELSSLGYHSKDGKILYDGRSQANTQGHRFTEGDQVMIEVCHRGEGSNSVMVRVWKNELPVALRSLDIKDHKELYATVSLFANGSPVACELITPNKIEHLPTYYVNNLLYWCLPADAHVSANEPEVHVSNQPRTGHCIVCPIPMSRGMHHFEVKMLEDPTELGVVPPMIALTTVSPYDPPRESNFHLDLLRFWPRNDGGIPTDGKQSSLYEFYFSVC
ncbi:hypothetical protein EB796_017433 [Bugula neritina]|uniref:SPRY domain-containing protein n=1 Tax=Bugula neritina TaxID=10212 RepID=A0A7J7JDA4_BUGNE|nr:hypothetical protein EB796_017433 [Bugula neritina]